jgi:hypothetical protein
VRASAQELPQVVGDRTALDLLGGRLGEHVLFGETGKNLDVEAVGKPTLISFARRALALLDEGSVTKAFSHFEGDDALGDDATSFFSWMMMLAFAE